MAASASYNISISATDAASAKIKQLNATLRALKAPKQLDAINKQIADLTKPDRTGLGKMRDALQRTFSIDHLRRVQTGFSKLTQGVAGAGKSLLSMVAPLAEITGAASVGGLAALAVHAADFAQHLQAAASWLGVAPSRMQQLQNASRLMGGQPGDLANTIQNIQDRQRRATYERDPEWLSAMRQMGIKQGTSATDTMRQSFDFIKAHQNDPALERRIAGIMGYTPEQMRLAEGKNSMAPEGGSAALNQMMADAKKWSLPKQQMKAFTDAEDRFYKSQMHLTDAVQNFGMVLSTQLSPILVPLMDKWATWVQNPANQQWLSDKVTQDVKQFIGWCKQLLPALEHIGSAVNSVAQFFGGWQNVIEGFLGLKLLGWVTNLVSPLVKLIVLVGRITGAFRGLAAIVSAASAPEWLLALLSAAGLYSAGVQGQKSAKTMASADTLGLSVAQTDENGMPTMYQDKSGNRYPSAVVDQMTADRNAGKSDHWLDALDKGTKPPGAAPPPSQSHWYNPASWFGGHKAASVAPAANKAISPQERTLLDTIAGKESGGDYRKLYGGKDFSTAAGWQHPDKMITAGSYTSTAAGRYQFLHSTWEAEKAKLGLKDFSPANQDKAAIDLAETRYKQQTGRDLDTDLKDPNRLPAIATALKNIWPSLPGGSQTHQGMQEFLTAFRHNQQQEVAQATPQQPQEAAQAPAVKVTPSPGAKIGGSADINVNFANTPAGTSTTASSKGVFAAPRVRYSMATAST